MGETEILPTACVELRDYSAPAKKSWFRRSSIATTDPEAEQIVFPTYSVRGQSQPESLMCKLLLFSPAISRRFQFPGGAPTPSTTKFGKVRRLWRASVRRKSPRNSRVPIL